MVRWKTEVVAGGAQQLRAAVVVGCLERCFQVNITPTPISLITLPLQEGLRQTKVVTLEK